MKKRKNSIAYLIPVLAGIFMITAIVLKIALPGKEPENTLSSEKDNQIQNETPQVPETPENKEETTSPKDKTPEPPKEGEQTPDTPTIDPEPPAEDEPPKTEEPPAEKEEPADATENDFTGGAWSTLLCNPDNALPKGYQDTLKLDYVQGSYLMDARVVPAMKAMIAAAAKDGVELLICSGYRSNSYQKQLFDNRVNIVMNEDPSLTYDEAVDVAATINAYPGTSEHETGLAADIVTPSYQRLNAGFDQTKAYQWLYEHCKEYGFIMRYPKDKTDITKIIYEPWHYRFVGTEHSYKIMEQKITYEEYLGKTN